jgi:ubiquitin C-terminal hydrolase
VINLDTNNDAEGLSQSLQNLLLDENFVSPVVVKKENKLITDYHYATFKNSYGENTCYINVILHLLYNMDDLVDFLLTLYQIDESNKASENNTEKDKNKNIDGQNEEKEEKRKK